MTTTDPTTIEASSSYVRREVELRAADRAVRDAFDACATLTAQESAAVLVPALERYQDARQARDTAADTAAAEAEYRAEVDKLEARYDRARKRLDRKHGRA